MSCYQASFLQTACIESVEMLAEALDARDPSTAGHSVRVSEYAHAIASVMGFSGEQAELIRMTAWLHDVGKIGISDSALFKPGPLTKEEFELIKQHPQIGRRILQKTADFRPMLDGVEQHHENFDGTGYPYGLAG